VDDTPDESGCGCVGCYGSVSSTCGPESAAKPDCRVPRSGHRDRSSHDSGLQTLVNFPRDGQSVHDCGRMADDLDGIATVIFGQRHSTSNAQVRLDRMLVLCKVRVSCLSYMVYQLKTESVGDFGS
jgi:hypothetical protein